MQENKLPLPCSKPWSIVLTLALMLAATGCHTRATAGSKRMAAPAVPATDRAPRPEPHVAVVPAFDRRGNAAITSPTSEIIWQGDSDGWHVRWSTTDVTAFRDASASSPAFSLTRTLQRAFDDDAAELRADDARIAVERRASGESPPSATLCTREVSAALLSLVGSLLSYRQTSSTRCGGAAHPDGETVVITLDLSHVPPNPITLSDLFPETRIIAVLTADKLVRQALEHAAPSSLAELVKALAASTPAVTDSECYVFPDDLLARFAFHHVEGQDVALRLGLPGAGPCRDRLTQLGLLLPVPSALRKSLELARSGREGALMPQLETVAAGRKTSWTARSSPD